MSDPIYCHLLDVYSSKTYDYAIGSATLYIQNGNAVGLYDYYDFDSKSWGARSFKAEIATRAARITAPNTAKNFSTCYGKTPAGLGC